MNHSHSIPKIFGIGLSRTGTKSLTRSLKHLGYKSIHYPRQFHFKQGRIVIPRRVLNNYQALIDTPIALDFPELDKRYPDSRFIYTVRSMDSWLDSCRRFFRPGRFWRDTEGELHQQFYGGNVFDEQRFREGYLRHHERVMSHFSQRPEQLLVLNICGGEGWPQLCRFLEAPIPDQSFPHRI